MNRGRTLSLLVSAAAFLPGPLLAAGDIPFASDSSGEPPARLVIQSMPESASVEIDGRVAGLTPLTVDSIKPGTHRIMLQHPDLESWLAEPVSDTIRISDGEQKVIRYSLGARHLIMSSPFGADVMLGDSVIGTTPFVAGPGMEGQTFTLRKSGYEAASLQLSASQPASIDVPLKKVWQNNGLEESYFRDVDGSGSGSAGKYVSGAATVVFGVTAAYLKIKADDRYQQFLDTNDGRLLSQTHRLDTAAGLAIAGTQISLALFTYFIFSK